MDKPTGDALRWSPHHRPPSDRSRICAATPPLARDADADRAATVNAETSDSTADTTGEALSIADTTDTVHSTTDTHDCEHA